MAYGFLEGIIYYPDTLPCPQADTDLVPRERRYLSDIGDVRNMRMFQQEFQATRNRIIFIFTEEEAREFREWYEEELVFGGSWFYADWPILNKDKKVPHRFVGQPKYQWLLGANPGMMGRSATGGGARDAVTMYKVTATVEVYDPRKIGKNRGVFTSKVYPLIAVDDVKISNTVSEVSEPPNYRYVDDAYLSHIIVGAEWNEVVLRVNVSDDAQTFNHQIVSGEWVEILIDTKASDDARTFNHEIVSGEWTARLIRYDYYNEDEALIQPHVIVGAEWVTDD